MATVAPQQPPRQQSSAASAVAFSAANAVSNANLAASNMSLKDTTYSAYAKDCSSIDLEAYGDSDFRPEFYLNHILMSVPEEGVRTYRDWCVDVLPYYHYTCLSPWRQLRKRETSTKLNNQNYKKTSIYITNC